MAMMSERVEQLLPDENFYAYDWDEDMDEDGLEEEMQQIDLLIKHNLKHGRWCIKENDQALF